MLSSKDVTNQAFTPTQFRPGYDEREVDEFLDQVVETLRYYERGGIPGPQAPATSAHVGTFTSTKYRRGYDDREVDEFLGKVVEALRYYEQGGRPAPQEPEPPARAESEGLARRATRWLRGDPPP
jgi:DivIVA domain-containing protein